MNQIKVRKDKQYKLVSRINDVLIWTAGLIAVVFVTFYMGLIFYLISLAIETGGNALLSIVGGLIFLVVGFAAVLFSLLRFINFLQNHAAFLHYTGIGIKNRLTKANFVTEFNRFQTRRRRHKMLVRSKQLERLKNWSEFQEN